MARKPAKPLQTHEMYDECWTAPASRFVTYDLRDEHWLRPLGLGLITRRLKPIYDVRDEEGKLISLLGSVGRAERDGLERDELRAAVSTPPLSADAILWRGSSVSDFREMLAMTLRTADANCWIRAGIAFAAHGRDSCNCRSSSAV